MYVSYMYKCQSTTKVFTPCPPPFMLVSVTFIRSHSLDKILKETLIMHHIWVPASLVPRLHPLRGKRIWGHWNIFLGLAHHHVIQYKLYGKWSHDPNINLCKWSHDCWACRTKIWHQFPQTLSLCAWWGLGTRIHVNYYKCQPPFKISPRWWGLVIVDGILKNFSVHNGNQIVPWSYTLYRISFWPFVNMGAR